MLGDELNYLYHVGTDVEEACRYSFCSQLTYVEVLPLLMPKLSKVMLLELVFLLLLIRP